MKMSNSDTERCVRILWTDSCSIDYGWCDAYDLDTKECFIWSVGYVIKDCEDVVVLATSYSEDNPEKINNPFLIPKCSIKRIDEITIKSTKVSRETKNRGTKKHT